MGFVTKQIVAKQSKPKATGAGRKAIDLSLVHSAQGEAYSVSRKIYEDLDLNNSALAFTDAPLTVVVVTEDSPLAIAMQGKRDNAKQKSPQFGSAEFTTILTQQNLIPVERPVGFKANFSLKAASEEVFAEISNQARTAIADSDQTIKGVYEISLEEITAFTPTKRGPRKKEVTEPEPNDPAQTDLFTTPGTVDEVQPEQEPQGVEVDDDVSLQID